MTLRTVWKVHVALAVLLAGACSGGSGGSTPQSPSPEDGSAVSASAYLTDLCGAQQAWLQGLQALNADLQEAIADPSNVQELKDATLAYFDGVVETTEEMVVAAQAAGVPDVADGEVAAGQVITILEQVGEAMRDARDQVADLSTDDAAAFSSELLVISGEMGESLGEAASGMDSFGSPELDAAMLEVPECQQIPA
jgi:hypothetical protein